MDQNGTDQNGVDHHAAGKPGAEHGLLCPQDVCGDVPGEEETRLGVPLIPVRAMARSSRTRSSGVRFDVLATRDPRIVAAAAVTIGSLLVAAGVGVAPIAGAAAIAVLVPAAVVDVEQRRLPDAWVGAALVVLIVALALEEVSGQPIDAGNPVVGALATALPVLALHLVSPTSMGFGDVKAAVVLGGAVGTIDWRLGAVALCIAALTASVTGPLTRRRTLPFGPFLVVGAALTLLAHDPILDSLFNSGVTP